MVSCCWSGTTTTVASAAGATDGLCALPGQLRLVLLPPGGQAVEEAELVLRGAVEGHLVLVLASLLREGAHALMHPLVAVDLGPLWRRRRGCHDGIDARLFLGCRLRVRGASAIETHYMTW